MNTEPGALRLTEMTPEDVRAHLQKDSRLIIPVGACDQYGPHLPIGAATYVAEAIANRLARDCGVLMAPTTRFGVNVPAAREFPGTATVREKTLHGFMNDLLSSWDEAGFSEFILITVHDNDSHVEAIATLTGTTARIRVIEALSVDLSGILDGERRVEHGGEALTSLMLFLYPDLVRMDRAIDFFPLNRATSTLRQLTRIPIDSPGSIGSPTRASADKGQAIFDRICNRIRDRVFADPV